jgi:hypothetical protein
MLMETDTLLKAAKMQWLQHSYTEVMLNQLQQFRNRMVMEAENASQRQPVDVNSVLAKLNAAYTARQITELVTKE